MSLLAAARVGVLAGLACALPVLIWVAAVLPGFSLSPGILDADLRSAVRGLWIAQGLVIALTGPRGVGSSWAEGVIALGILVAVPLPLLSAAWLAGAAEIAVLGAGIGLLLASSAGVVVLARALAHLTRSGEVERISLAALEMGLGVAVWVFRADWLGWTGL